MKTSIIAIVLCIFLFFLPLQCYIMGNDFGVGIQGAPYRYQMTGWGNSLVPLTYEIGYVTSGIYTHYAAFSVLFWGFGTVLLSIMTAISLIFWNRYPSHILNLVLIGTGCSAMLFLISCFFRYGLFLSGPTGTCLPAGILLMAMFTLYFYYFRDTVFGYKSSSPKV